MKSPFLAVYCVCALAHADVIFDLGDHHQPGEVNVLTIKGETGTTVMGRINEFPAVTVDFTSTEELLTNANGQAQVTGCAAPCVLPPFETSPIDNMSISLANGLTYGDLILDPHITNDCATCGGTAAVTVTAETSGGIVEPPFSFTYALSKGENFLTITTTGGERILNTHITDPLNFSDMRQVRLSGLPGTPIPEPSTYALMAISLGAITVLRKKRKV
jgi:hypothetical protein